MKKETRKAKRITKRIMAFCMAAALCLFTLAIASPAEAAIVKPKLAVKKKTLYYNKAEKKTYTLKLKTNKAKIVRTTWKTSKKSVVSISKKKKTSVKLTAKKKGNSTITATVKYVPKGKWMVRTLKLKCKITSKAAGSSTATTPTPTPKNTPTVKPKVTPTPTPTKPAGNDPALSNAAEIELDKSELLFASTEEGENTYTLSAVVKDKNGKELKDPELTWSTDNDDAVSVDGDGVVTAKAGGTANITASIGKIESDPCVVTVDTTAPAIEGAIITDYKTITVYFDEAVQGTPEIFADYIPQTPVKLTELYAEKTAGFTLMPVLAEDGKSLTLSSITSLPAATYNIAIGGLTDRVGNALKNDGKVSVVKEISKPEQFICKTEEVPAGQKEVTVRYAVTDQYGEEQNEIISDLTVQAETESGMPLTTKLEKEYNRIIISGAVSMLAEGKKILITLSSASLNLKGEISTVVVSSEGAGIAVNIDKVSAESLIMENLESDMAPEFVLRETEAENVFVLGAELSDKFGGKAGEQTGVVYVIKEGKGVVEFIDADHTDTSIAEKNESVQVKANKGGIAVITAYLASDDSKRMDIRIVIRATTLREIAVSELANGYNMQASEAKIMLTPAGTGLSAKDLKCKIVENAGRVEEASCVEDVNTGDIYVSIKAKSDELSDPIKFRVYYDNGTPEDEGDDIESPIMTYNSSPMSVVDSIYIEPFSDNVAVGDTITTTYKLLNRYGENINTIAADSLIAEAAAGSSKINITGLKVENGVLTVQGANPGMATINLTYGEINKITANATVEVVEAAHVNKVCYNLEEGQNGAKLIYSKPGKIDDIPVAFYDQHGKAYELKKSGTDDLTIKINGKVDDTGKLNIEYLTGMKGNYTVATERTDVITAIRIGYGTGVNSGDVLQLSFGHELYESFESEILPVVIQPAPKLEKLEFENSALSAVIESEVVNPFTMTDQYGDEWNGVAELGIQVMKDKEVVQDAGSVNGQTGNTSVTLLDAGTYVVTIYVGEDIATATIKTSYTLIVDSAKNLIKTLEISDEVEIRGHSYKRSEVESMRMSSDTAEWTTLGLEYKAYDENKKEVVMGTVKTSDLIWTVTGKNVKAEYVAGKQVKVSKSGNNETGIVTVQLHYVPGDIKISADIQVSCENSRAKVGTYRIALGAEDNIQNTTQFIEGRTDFTVKATDQYGDSMDLAKLYTVIVDDDTVADVEIAGGTFTVISKSLEEKTTLIKVYVTETEILTFTVKAKRVEEATPTQSPSTEPTATPDADPTSTPDADSTATPDADPTPTSDASETMVGDAIIQSIHAGIIVSESCNIVNKVQI